MFVRNRRVTEQLLVVWGMERGVWSIAPVFIRLTRSDINGIECSKCCMIWNVGDSLVDRKTELHVIRECGDENAKMDVCSI